MSDAMDALFAAEKRIRQLEWLINQWADAEDEADMIRGIDLYIVYQALRKVVGR